MSHELEIKQDGVASMWSGENITPWHGLGVVTKGLETAEDALKLAGLDWDAELKPAFFEAGDGKFSRVPNRYAVVRSTDSKPLGLVGSDYKVAQNREAFAFFDTVTDQQGEAHYTSAGSLFGGSRIFLTAKLGEGFTVAEEDHDLYLLITNSHDGSRAFTAATTMIRAVCQNTVTMGLSQAKTKWSLRHKSTLAGRAEEARTALQIAWKNADVFQAEVQKLIDISVTDDQFKSIVESVLPEQKRQKDLNVASLMNIWESEPTIVDTPAKGNAWGAFNAVTYWTDHVRKSKSTEGRMVSLLDGFGARTRNSVHDRLLALA